MRVRDLLLTSTSLALLLVGPSSAQAPDPLTSAYEDYLQAQQSGGDAAVETALGSLTEECRIEGYSSLEECLSALGVARQQFETNLNLALGQYQAALDQAAAGDYAGARPAADEAAASIRELCLAQGFSSVEACIGQSLPPLPEPPADAPAEPAPTPEPIPEASSADPSSVEEPEPAPAEPEQPAGEPTAESQAQFETNLNLALEQYQAALDQAAAGDYAGARPVADEAAASIRELCLAQGFDSVEACIGQSLPPLPEPPADAPAEPAPTPEPMPEASPAEPSAVEEPEPAPAEPEQPAGEPSEDSQAQFETNLNLALDRYQAALDQAAAGDYAGARPVADEAAASIRELCLAQGFDSVEACIGQSLPPLQEPPADAPAEPAPEPIPEARPAEPSAVEEPEPAPAEPEQPAGEPTAESQAQFETNLNLALEQYQAALDQAAAGDYAGARPVADEAAASIRELCLAQGFDSVEACIGQSLPPLPEPPADAPAEPEQTPEATPEPTPEAGPAEPSAVEEPEPAPAEPEQPAGEPSEASQAQFETNLNLALDRYQAALDQAAAGDYAGARPVADEAAASIRELCLAQGFDSVEACIGQSLPPLPEPPAPTPEATPEPTPEARPAEPSAVEEPEQPAQAEPEQPAGEPSEDSQAQFETNLNLALDRYQAALDQAAAGAYDGARLVADEAAASIRELCLAQGFDSVEACIGQSLPPLPEPPADAPAEPAATPEPTPEASPVEPSAVEEQEPAQAEPEQPAGEPSEDSQAQFETNLNFALGQYQAALDQAAAGDYDGARPVADEAAASIRELCLAQGFDSVEACIGQSLPPLPEPPADAPVEPAPTPEPTPEAHPAEPSAVEEPEPVLAEPEQPAGDPLDLAEASIRAAVAQYSEGVAKLEAGDPSGQNDLDAATLTLDENCGPFGYATREECAEAFGLSLPATSVGGQRQARDQGPPPALSIEDAPASVGRPERRSPPAREATPVTEDPEARAEQQIFAAYELYISGVGKLDRGDPTGQAEIDAARGDMEQNCGPLGYRSVAACLDAYGLALRPLQRTRPAEALTPPTAQDAPLIGADQRVTESAVEPLPAAVVPEEAAPLLDSQKIDTLRRRQLRVEAQPAPVVAPPTSDVQAQVNIQQVTVQQPVTAEVGRPVEPEAVVFAPPQNVTIINNVNVENNSTTINNTINNTVNNTRNTTNITNNLGDIIEEDNSIDVEVDIDVENDRSFGDITRRLLNPREPRRPSAPPVTREARRQPAPPVNGFVFQLGAQLVISNPEQDRQRIYDPTEDEISYEILGEGRIRETLERPGGVRVVTIRSRQGEVLRRSRFNREGREHVLVYGALETEEASPFEEDWEDPGEELPPLRLNIPVSEYIFDADEAEDEEIELFFSQPPVEPVRRLYSLDEVKHSARVRDSVRRLEIGDLTFETGKATISRDQIGTLRNVGNAMLDLLAENPAETFLIEGHADAVGSEVSNLELSDRRAATVARVLTEFYRVPPENLTTQGYGETFLKVRTNEAERLNRRVAIRRVTPLITIAEQ